MFHEQPPPSGHPRRYPRWRMLSCAIDLLTVIDEELRELGDGPNAQRAQAARFCVLAIARGAATGGERQA